jgi:hypothetical protein
MKSIKLILFISAFTMVIFLNKTSISQVSFGVNAGVIYNGLTGDVPEDAVYKRKLGFSTGIISEYKFKNDIIAGVGIGYLRTGTIISYDTGDKETKDSIDISISYITFPLSVKLLTGSKFTYFSSGLDLKMLLSADRKFVDGETSPTDIKEKLQKYDASIFAGFGGIIPLGKTNLGIELRYSHSLTNISKDITSSSSGLPARFRFTGFQLILSFNYAAK